MYYYLATEKINSILHIYGRMSKERGGGNIPPPLSDIFSKSTKIQYLTAKKIPYLNQKIIQQYFFPLYSTPRR